MGGLMAVMGAIAPIVSVGASIAGAVMGAQQADDQAALQVMQYKMQAEQNERNAQLSAINANIAKSDTAREQRIAAEEAAMAKGRQRAAMAEGGILGSATGTILETESEARAKEQDLLISRQGEIEQLNYLGQQSDLYSASAIAYSNANAAEKSGSYAKTASILGGVSDVFGYVSKYHGGPSTSTNYFG